jgi:hypothetical protein
MSLKLRGAGKLRSGALDFRAHGLDRLSAEAPLQDAHIGRSKPSHPVPGARVGQDLETTPSRTRSHSTRKRSSPRSLCIGSVPMAKQKLRRAGVSCSST